MSKFLLLGGGAGLLVGLMVVAMLVSQMGFPTDAEGLGMLAFEVVAIGAGGAIVGGLAYLMWGRGDPSQP